MIHYWFRILENVPNWTGVISYINVNKEQLLPSLLPFNLFFNHIEINLPNDKMVYISRYSCTKLQIKSKYYMFIFPKQHFHNSNITKHSNWNIWNWKRKWRPSKQKNGNWEKHSNFVLIYISAYFYLQHGFVV